VGKNSPSIVRLVVTRLRWPILSAAGLIAIAAAGYVVVADYSWMDALYMTVITLATVGYGEVQPLTAAGRWWTIVTIIAGFAVFVNATAQLTALLLSGEIRDALEERRRSKMRDRLERHVIVVGYGRVGRATANSIREAGLACAVVEEDTSRADDIIRAGAVFVQGDGRDIETLQAAGIDHAIALSTALDDPDNLVVIVTARTLRPDLRIVSRVNDIHWSERLRRAGASQLVPVYESAGASIAATALSPEVLAVQELTGLGMRTEEILVPAGSPLAGCDLASVMERDPDLVLIGVRRDDGLTRWHEVQGTLREGDVVVAMGSSASLAELAASMAAGN
jgi:voltage-gated potassium channel